MIGGFRVQAGECYHLFTRHHLDQLQDYLLPEILRTRLEELCLQIKLLKLGMIYPFIEKAMQTPSLEALQRSVECLHDLVSSCTAARYALLSYEFYSNVSSVVINSFVLELSLVFLSESLRCP